MSSLLKFLSVSFLCALFLSGINPHDYYIWALEVMPVVIGFIILSKTFKTFKFTNLTYTLIYIHALILIVGGHYTYAQVLFFNYLKEMFDLSRNYYDRVGHIAQGFVPAIISREVLLRKSVVNGKGWLFFIIVCICLAFSAFYEFLEWWVAISSGLAADDFLAVQGDIWDTQWDMFLAFLGACISLVFLSKLHDRYLNKIS